MVRHDASYTYDNAGRLTAVADTATGSTLDGSYTWHADGSLASYPGPGYTRTLQYDDAGNLASITRDYGTYTELAFEYQTGFDGKRRWKKDHTTEGEPEYWYPCGVACCAGELVTLISMNGGNTWDTHRTFVRGVTGVEFINDESQLVGLGNDISGFDSTIGLTGTTVIDAHGLPRAPFAGQFGNAFEDENGEDLKFRQWQVPINSVKDCEDVYQRELGKLRDSRSLCETTCKIVWGVVAGVSGAIGGVVGGAAGGPLGAAILVGATAVVSAMGYIVCLDKCKNNFEAAEEELWKQYLNCKARFIGIKPESIQHSSGALAPPPLP